MGAAFDHATHTFEFDFGHEKQTFYSALVIPKVCGLSRVGVGLAVKIKSGSATKTSLAINSVPLFGHISALRSTIP